MFRCIPAFSLFLCSPLSLVVAADAIPAQLFPKTTIAYAEFPDPPAFLTTLLDHPLREKIEALEPYRQAIQTPGYRGFLAGRKFVEIQLGMEWREALEKLTHGGIYIGFDAATEGLVILVKAKDAESLDTFRSKLLELTKLGKNPDQIKEGEYRGLSVYQADKAKFAVVDEWLIVSNKSEAGKFVLDRILDEDFSDSLQDEPVFQEAIATRPRNNAIWSFVNLSTLRDAGVAKKLFSGKADDPGGELLIGGILSSLQKTPFATGQIAATQEELEFQLSIPHDQTWVPEEREFFFGPEGSGRAPALPDVDDTLFTLGTFRDISEMWLRAGDLFNEQINDGFAEADANLTTLFAGKDFGEDILGALTPEIGFIAARRDFSDVLPSPAIKLPKFALVVNLKEPETMTRELRRTFQSMIGFFNVLGAMEGRPQLEMDMDKLDNGAQLVTSTYVPEVGEEESEYADVLFNFSPSIGFIGERFVVSSTDEFARELVLAKTSKRDESTLNTDAKLIGASLRNVLTDNREQLISQNMLEEGNTREEAEAAIALVLELIGYVKDVSLELDTAAEALSLRLALTVQD